jgi:hypothetical protein
MSLIFVFIYTSNAYQFYRKRCLEMPHWPPEAFLGARGVICRSPRWDSWIAWGHYMWFSGHRAVGRNPMCSPTVVSCLFLQVLETSPYRGGAAEILTKHPSLIYFCRKEAWLAPLKKELEFALTLSRRPGRPWSCRLPLPRHQVTRWARPCLAIKFLDVVDRET